ncbi:MAG: thiamine-phosphate kinase [Aquificae bacterium]|nr:thiamine-phosphate kinase [Aquificota bacterium]
MLKIGDLGELQLVELISKYVNTDLIGDDTAPVKLGNFTLLLTTDSMNEGIHFLRNYPPESVGWKAVSVNVSDCVANGGLPRWLLVDLSLPESLEVSYLERLYEGMRRACEFYGCQIVGGNLSRSEKIRVSLSLVGLAERFVGRKGARPGDALFVSGTLGDSRAGLELLLMEKRDYEDFELRLIERHLRPTARTDYVRHIVKYASASMDISDGLLIDAYRMSRRSSVALELYTDKIPLSEELKLFCEKYRKDPLEYALRGGEDYQLLFTHPTGRWNPFLDMTQIGIVKEGEGIYLDGKKVQPEGWKHF